MRPGAFQLAMCQCVVLMATLANIGNAQTEEDYYWSNGQKVPLRVHTDVLAIEGDRTAVRLTASGSELMNGVRGFWDNENPRAADLSRVRVFGVKIDPDKKEEIKSKVRQKGGLVRRTGLIASVGIRGEQENNPLVVITSEFVIRFKPDVLRSRIDTINEVNNVEVVRLDPYVKNQYVLRAKDLDASRTLKLANKYYELPETDELSHPNFIVPAKTRSAWTDDKPNDRLFALQWHLHNTGQTGGKAGADVRALEAWKTTRGDPSIVVAVLDPDGVQTNHEDLILNKFINAKEIPDDGMDNDDNGFVDDVSGWNFLNDNNVPVTNLPHGTAAAGIAVAKAGNEKGGAGIAPECKLLGVMLGNEVTEHADAFHYARIMGASVISCSWGYPIGTPATQVVEEAITRAGTEGRGGKGCVICFAMTNEKRDNFGGSGEAPDISSHPRVLAIGRSTNLDLWGHSGFGKGMALLAPSNAAKGSPTQGCLSGDLAGTIDITTTDLMGRSGYNNGLTNPADLVRKCFCNENLTEIENAHYTACFGGTSAATPLTAGVAALVLSVNPDLTAEQVYDILKETAEKINTAAADYKPDAKGRGYSNTHGYGRLNAAKAVQRAQALKAAPKPAPSKASSPRDPQSGHSVISAPVPAVQEYQDKVSKINGKNVREFMLRDRGERKRVFVIENLFAISVSSDANAREIVSQLAKSVKPAADVLPQGYEAYNLGLFEISPGKYREVNDQIEALARRGLIKSIGWGVYFDPEKPSTMSVLTDRLSVPFKPEANEEQIRAFVDKHKWSVVRRERFEKTAYLLEPRTRSIEPLPTLLNEFVQHLQESGIADVDRIQLHWIAPIQKRPEPTQRTEADTPTQTTLARNNKGADTASLVSGDDQTKNEIPEEAEKILRDAEALELIRLDPNQKGDFQGWKVLKTVAVKDPDVRSKIMNGVKRAIAQSDQVAPRSFRDPRHGLRKDG